MPRAAPHAAPSARAVAVAAVDDLFFASKLKEAALGVGVQLLFTHSLAETVEAAASSGTRLVILDLNGASYSRVEAVKALKADPRTSGARTVGYLSHVMVELKAQAVEAGCDLVLARSAFVKRLPALLEEA
jgi:CheY-like chemotaxis protein